MQTLIDKAMLYIWMVLHCSEDPNNCRFGSPLSPLDNYSNSFLNRSSVGTQYRSWRDIITTYYTPYVGDNPDPFPNDEAETAFRMLQASVNETRINSDEYMNDAGSNHFGIRTCNSFWNPQVTISETNVDPFYLGMSSQATEREDHE